MKSEPSTRARRRKLRGRTLRDDLFVPKQLSGGRCLGLVWPLTCGDRPWASALVRRCSSALSRSYSRHTAGGQPLRSRCRSTSPFELGHPCEGARSESSPRSGPPAVSDIGPAVKHRALGAVLGCLVVEENELEDSAVGGDDLPVLVVWALLQEIDDNRPVWVEPLALQQLSQPAPEVVLAGP